MRMVVGAGFCVALGLALVVSAAAWAASPEVKGRWVGQTAECGDLILTIKTQGAKGALEGTLDCSKTKVSQPFGVRLIPGQQLAGSIEGDTVVLDGERMTTRLTLQDGKLVGYTTGPNQPKVQLSFVKK
jgi:hypothetical protein